MNIYIYIYIYIYSHSASLAVVPYPWATMLLPHASNQTRVSLPASASRRVRARARTDSRTPRHTRPHAANDLLINDHRCLQCLGTDRHPCGSHPARPSGSTQPEAQPPPRNISSTGTSTSSGHGWLPRCSRAPGRTLRDAPTGTRWRAGRASSVFVWLVRWPVVQLEGLGSRV